MSDTLSDDGMTIDKSSLRNFFRENGYVVAEALFSAGEVEHLKQHYMDLRATGSHPGDFEGVGATNIDPLKKYPRMIQMHHWDQTSLNWMLDARLREGLTACAGREPFAVQTMLYFKPPGARGQALHQDNFYLKVQPGTCIAAWLALDDCDEANGCMRVVPGSHTWPTLCTAKADTTQSFTDVTVNLPPNARIEPIVMKAGDVLFFNGQLVHGSYPNTTTDRFRRALIGHYIDGDAQRVGAVYHPVLRMDGTAVAIGNSPNSTRCGVWVEEDGTPVIEEREMAIPAPARE
jgi:ectoine hydroxylase-related dioxygenase (phytanoyl-CoA dioxygenase family)